MAAAVGLRGDYDAGALRMAAKRSKDGPQARRLLALAAIYDGASRTEAAKIGGVTLQVVRDWVVRFNAQGPDGLIDRKAPGQQPRLNEAHRAALAAIIESGPIPAVHGVVRWRIVDLRQWIFEEFRVVVAEQTLSRVLRKMGYRKLSARPRQYAQAEDAIEDFKKAFPRAWKRSGARKAFDPGAIEVWFADEARIGQKNKIARRWAKRGSRPSAPSDQRTASAYIFGAICPKEGKGAALIMPRCDTEAMNLHLAEIATQVAPHGHAAILLDQAGWRLSGGLKIPSNITLDPAACQMSRTQPARKHLAVHPRQLALKPHLQILRRHRRPLLPRMEHAHRSALENHVHRHAPLAPTSSNHRVLV